MSAPRTHPSVRAALEAVFPSTTAATLPARDERLTEAGAAERFVREHGDALRYDHRRGRWLLWGGHRWTQDTDQAVTRIALAFVRRWQREAVEIADSGRRHEALAYTMRLERRDALASMLALARDLKPIADAGDAFDADPWLLGAPNGVIDLRTGALRNGHPDDRITMAVSVPYDPDAECPRWHRFIGEVFGGNADLVAYIHRAVGYSLTGLTAEQCLFLNYGTGANGKGTLLNTLATVLGDYAYAMPFSTVELQNRAAIPNDVAALAGRRFVTASETSDGSRLNESRIKALTGGDPITARFLHGEYFTFKPVATFWLAVNHLPIVRDDSHGFWRRIRLIPFRRTFEVNPRLADELLAEGPGILAWAVRGCLAWQQGGGLNPPDAVLHATRQYAQDSDPLAGFLAEACELRDDARIGAGELYQQYRQWCDRHGLAERERLSATAFGRKVAERFRHERTRTGRVYFGLTRREV